jgi:hypothetical protein
MITNLTKSLRKIRHVLPGFVRALLTMTWPEEHQNVLNEAMTIDSLLGISAPVTDFNESSIHPI